ncbi:SNF2 domain-containing protein CLASSY 1 isoform X1 [Arachis hypogaea]|nr:SNF2 domain-containing protein CLASSY 1 isoform X1 [Arachis hypogaea]
MQRLHEIQDSYRFLRFSLFTHSVLPTLNYFTSNNIITPSFHTVPLFFLHSLSLSLNSDDATLDSPTSTPAICYHNLVILDMVGKRKYLHQSKHPFNAYPFEACVYGSWKAVEFIKIEYGVMSIHFIDKRHISMEKGPSADVRIRSRIATTADCSCILRRGIDVCVLSSPQGTGDSDEFDAREPVWRDARISSIQRKPHDSECTCQFYVNYYVNQGSLGAEMKTLNKDINVVGLDHIFILQRLEHTHCDEDQHYRWTSTEDCSRIPQTRLLLGKFLPDISWLIATSVLKKVSFFIRSVENKLVYEVLSNDIVIPPFHTESHINVVNFKLEKDMLIPIVSQVIVSRTERVDYEHQESHEDEVSPSSYNVQGLRRSKRRHVQPDRYLGCNSAPELNIGTIRTRPYKLGTWEQVDEDHELSMPLSSLFGLKQISQDQDLDSSPKESKVNGCQEIIVYNRRAKAKEAKPGDADRDIQLNELAIIPHPTLKHHKLNDMTCRIGKHEPDETPSKYSHLVNSTKQKRNSVNLLNFNPDNVLAQLEEVEKSDGFSSRCHYTYSYSTSKFQRKALRDLDDMNLAPKWEGIHSSKGAQDRRYRPAFSRNRHPDEERTYKDRTLNATAYKELINSYLKNINTKPTKEEMPISDQWKQFQDSRSVGKTKEIKISNTDYAEDTSELDSLWREMEVSLASSYIEDTEDANAANLFDTQEISKEACEHYFRLDDEIGICCLKCGFVEMDIKAITPAFIQHSVWHQEERQNVGKEDAESKAAEFEDFNLVSNVENEDEPVLVEHDNVWALIPDLRKKLHIHQKKAFEFLWRNIAGSTEPALMDKNSRKRGGCVISHTPGAGKTFLIIAFLVSYLKLFPGKKPLVLAPKTTLYTWYKEFIKWEIPIPVYLIHGRRTYRVFNQKQSMVFPGMPKPTEDVKHVLDCLEKIQKWHSHPSVLIMGYTSFLTLMREDSKYAHRKYMAKVLRESPGLLVLDEGHNPRSTKSRLRKVLMKVQTELRILLSGTLFQNNFCEYFNTLLLARPKFAHEVLKVLDPKYKKKKGKVRAVEYRARKFFIEVISRKIDSNNGEERMQGLNMLRNLTNGFIDVYEGSSSDDLPGLQIYTLLMNTTDTQHEMLKRLHKKMQKCNGYPLELELLITLGSIHPWLIKTAVCANKFFTMEELRELEKCKFDLKMGSKVKFVMSLIYRVVQKEKILIFCHNIAPVKLFIEYFELFFKWQKGREILVLTGELELFERGRVMDKFEEPGGVSKILLASITACAEGISLTAASRVIMLDSEWNPSKTKQAIARAFRPGQQKMVYVYQLLVTGSLEEDKYRRTTWKEWVSSMIFSEEFVEDPSQWQAQKIEDEILREMVEEDKSKSFHMIMKNEKASTNNR